MPPGIIPGYMSGSTPLAAAADSSAMPGMLGKPEANGFCIIWAIIELDKDELRLFGREPGKLWASDDFSVNK